ncbi:baeRF7 domain-containing protein [Nostoc sp. UHCC 0870]|uniref:baeRF7 domain-containing protein n=1 Tax=Nostoc sp. UHCC 0870 TaxID=2914041 RepID=UPI001EDEDC8A|nr:hypothetical protein [Nostoc sp. UHCC 0870]UKO97226.1 hypothetical protein L6494_21970 [Nostoc sp. UHCC 0870]
MTLLSIDELKTLVENSHTPCLSLYIPMQKLGAEIRQNPIRFKNVIREAQERLEVIGMRSTEAINFLQPAMELDQNDFWEHQDQGLAIFISPEIFRYYCLPMESPELVVVGNKFHIKPLLHLINSDRQFYLLTLSQQDVRFFEGDYYDIKEVEVENMPKNLEEVLLMQDNSEKGVQHRMATSRGGTANPAQQPGQFHGEGSPEMDRPQAGILQFCYAVDKALHDKLRDKQAPLIVAGVEYLHPLYQEANTYPHLLEEGITGNHEVTNLEELHHQAWPIVSPLAQQKQEEAIALYEQLAGEDVVQASGDIKEIVPAAYYQKVDTLFVSLGQQLWGKFDPDTMTVDLHPEPQPDDEDMLDFAAVHTFLNGGHVYTVEPEEMPNNQLVAAIFRY